mmetsp:Transcript_32921/g.79644  ORF Transcript_32921/g.79644 Transcript_32921/m.79644 type:complete len:951 (+) Transcript_32921:207-3059(+)|eukprot:CAMPEP_0113642896 /NCGR_PEP_ID=MMETSP0017_2-20120614/22539_1 /TAXON_ID=2856 /ORGANISM="Cylindrotheca closterium" /LENGTH=950 /DNA_ID=CAMNT_0000554351 /DNA_START=95 /DNA_END=2947 /DNA_ORIENTATION=- /assembly_acc=CAM_ASM_000147
MFDVTNFLMRWLFLCNLIRDIAEIQTIPRSIDTRSQYIEDGTRIQGLCEEEWRDNCLRGILSYPPGSQRLLVIDSMRAELVQQLTDSLVDADETARLYEDSLKNESSKILQPHSVPPLDEDADILKAFRKETRRSPDDNNDGNQVELVSNSTNNDHLQDSSIDHKLDFGNSEEFPRRPPTAVESNDAQLTARTVRDYLPQLVSVVLKSPPPFESRLLNPIDKLRQVIIDRCVEDANWGVDMCWLLEAEVGRTWKKLFEHRQQTGRRLIVVLPAEKAAVLAKIGNEKREAFDLLQDSEQATAYGHTASIEEELNSSGTNGCGEHFSSAMDNASFRLPSSLSLRRCSHFGDTMHFIDRLTKISLELRRVPTIHRATYLHDSLREMNRRLRRRMITKGDVSLDVEDSRGPDDWPQHTDVSTGFLQYSVHLPLDPKQNNRWPGSATSETIGGGAVRVLNIVVDECRLLSSRERCPFLVHLEVAETGLNGRDSRLYASGAPGLGTTIEEALSMSALVGTNTCDDVSDSIIQASYQIPSELLVSSSKETHSVDSPFPVVDQPTHPTDYVRGGSQTDEMTFYPLPPDSDDMLASIPYSEVRQQQYEQLHHQMFVDESTSKSVMPNLSQRNPVVSIREGLLTQVFGQKWEKKCHEIKQASPFGKTKGWRLASFIMKAGEDIRREALVMQIIVKLNEWFQGDIPEEIRPHLRPYTIMCVGGDAGLVECLNDAKSIDEVKKRTDSFQSLRDYFERAYGPSVSNNLNDGYAGNGQKGKTLTFTEARENFLRSLVGYSLVCYILQIKDRHNANILLDREGNIIHIDFGFVLGDTPKMGKVPIFSERAPFKLSGEFWDVLGGWNVQQGGLGVRFCNMFERAFASAASHVEEIVSLVEATMLTLTQNPRQARILANGIRSRLRMRGQPGSREQKAFVMELVNAALTSWGTSTYDWLQKNMNGYQ